MKTNVYRLLRRGDPETRSPRSVQRAALMMLLSFTSEVAVRASFAPHTGHVASRRRMGPGHVQIVLQPGDDGAIVVEEGQPAYIEDAVLAMLRRQEFIGAKVLVAGLRKAGPNPTREKIVKALETLNKYDVGGFAVSFAPDNRIGSRFVEVTIIGKNGSLLR